MTKDKMLFKEICKIHKECPVCEIERDLIYGETKDTLKIRKVDIDVVSKIHYCPEGNHYFYSIEDEEDKFQVAYREFRKRKGLLQPEEIRAIRNQYRLSQKDFALLFGWGEITIHRYETGAIQDEPHNDVLMLIKEFDNFKKYFLAKKGSLGSDIAKKIEAKITAIEKERSICLMEKVFSMINKDRPLAAAPMQSALLALYYEKHPDDKLQDCNDNELALAA